MLKYRIFEKDESHLKEIDVLYGEKRARICLIESDFVDCDSFEEAISDVQNANNHWREYIILPVVYTTPYDDEE